MHDQMLYLSAEVDLAAPRALALLARVDEHKMGVIGLERRVCARVVALAARSVRPVDDNGALVAVVVAVAEVLCRRFIIRR